MEGRETTADRQITISAIATAVPDHCFTLAEAKACLPRAMPLAPERLPAIHSIFDHAGVDRRYSPFSIEHLTRKRSLTEISREYREHSVRLGRRVAAACLIEAGVTASEVDFLITVSCTGVMMPSLDAYLINEMGFRSDIRRLPITELGCAAGAVALSRARDFVGAYPDARVLVVSVELSTLTFQSSDVSMANLVSCALFGDGAAAALITGRPSPGMRILESQSHLFPDSYDALGFDLTDGGLHIVLGKQLPQMLRCRLGDLVRDFLARQHLAPEALSFVVLHPGGKKLIEEVEQALGLSRYQTQPTWDILRAYGNLSSAAILFILREWLTNRPLRSGDRGLILAFGPGFSAEMLLLECA